MLFGGMSLNSKKKVNIYKILQKAAGNEIEKKIIIDENGSSRTIPVEVEFMN